MNIIRYYSLQKSTALKFCRVLAGDTTRKSSCCPGQESPMQFCGLSGKGYVSLRICFVLAWWLECLSMARETWVQSKVMSYQRLKKWYLMPPCLTLSIIRYGSRVKWSNPGKGAAPSPTLWCSSYQKGSLQVTLNYGRQLLLIDRAVVD